MRPLTHWRIRAARLPERLTEDTLFDASFRLPGADALSAFADLLGGAPDEDCGSAPDMQEADFTLPAAIPADVSGTVELAVELDFGTLCADDAELTLELVRGKGRVLADDMPLCAFQNPKDGFLRVPLTRALHAGRKQTIRLCFDASRPAGVLGPVNLRLTTRARLRDVVLLPDAAARTVRLRATLAAMETGRYVLRARTACKGDVLPMHDLPVSLTAGEPQTVEMTLPLPANPFMAGGRPIPPRSAVYTGPSRRALRRNDAALRLWRPTRLLRYAAPPLGMPRPRRAAGAHRAHAPVRRSA